jgi:hypothetical protein
VRAGDVDDIVEAILLAAHMLRTVLRAVWFLPRRSRGRQGVSRDSGSAEKKSGFPPNWIQLGGVLQAERELTRQRPHHTPPPNVTVSPSDPSDPRPSTSTRLARAKRPTKKPGSPGYPRTLRVSPGASMENQTTSGSTAQSGSLARPFCDARSGALCAIWEWRVAHWHSFAGRIAVEIASCADNATTLPSFAL